MARAKKDLTLWRNTAEGVALYQHARGIAQKQANESGRDYGLEANDLFKTWNWFMVPARQYRTGHELRCEIVSPENLSTTQAGHGYA